VSCASRASVNLSEITAMESNPSAPIHFTSCQRVLLRVLVDRARNRSTGSAHSSEMRASADNLRTLIPILRTPRSEAGQDLCIRRHACSRLLYLDVRSDHSVVLDSLSQAERLALLNTAQRHLLAPTQHQSFLHHLH
jgi:hypothetical protein